MSDQPNPYDLPAMRKLRSTITPRCQAHGLKVCEECQFGATDAKRIAELEAENAKLLGVIECANETARRRGEELSIAKRHLSYLLARIHRDGGHHEQEHGTQKAVEDAEELWAKILAAAADNACLAEQAQASAIELMRARDAALGMVAMKDAALLAVQRAPRIDVAIDFRPLPVSCLAWIDVSARVTSALAATAPDVEKYLAGVRAEALTMIPAPLAAAILKAGRLEWGATAEKSDAEHVEDFATTLQLTREANSTPTRTKLHGGYLEGGELVLCHTGTSPNSPIHARILVGLWNSVHDALEARAAALAKEGK